MTDTNSDYGLNITIHDLGGAVEDAVCRAHREYEPKFYDWMQSEIEAHVDDKVFHALREKFDSDNANTEQRIDVNEVEAMIDDATASLQTYIISMQEEINFLHEKYQDIYNRRLSSRIAKVWNRIFKGGA